MNTLVSTVVKNVDHEATLDGVNHKFYYEFECSIVSKGKDGGYDLEIVTRRELAGSHEKKLISKKKEHLWDSFKLEKHEHIDIYATIDTEPGINTQIEIHATISRKGHAEAIKIANIFMAGEIDARVMIGEECITPLQTIDSFKMINMGRTFYSEDFSHCVVTNLKDHTALLYKNVGADSWEMKADLLQVFLEELEITKYINTNLDVLFRSSLFGHSAAVSNDGESVFVSAPMLSMVDDVLHDVYRNQILRKGVVFKFQTDHLGGYTVPLAVSVSSGKRNSLFGSKMELKEVNGNKELTVSDTFGTEQTYGNL